MENAASQTDIGALSLATRLRCFARWLLLGSEDSWGATLATGPLGIFLLAGVALLVHLLDLATGVRMMQMHGIELEQNPLARSIMRSAGPLGLVEAKLGVVLAGLGLLVLMARAGRPRLARNCLLLAVCLGVLGWTSNLVG